MQGVREREIWPLQPEVELGPTLEIEL
jgi:hypothetical protein